MVDRSLRTPSGPAFESQLSRKSPIRSKVPIELSVYRTDRRVERGIRHRSVRLVDDGDDHLEPLVADQQRMWLVLAHRSGQISALEGAREPVGSSFGPLRNVFTQPRTKADIAMAYQSITCENEPSRVAASAEEFQPIARGNAKRGAWVLFGDTTKLVDNAAFVCPRYRTDRELSHARIGIIKE